MAKLFEPFTELELKIATLLALPNEEIATALGYSCGTIKNKITEMKEKCGVTNRSSLLVTMLRRGYIHLDELPIKCKEQ